MRFSQTWRMSSAIIEKEDFNDWILSAIVDCTASVDTFENQIANLTQQQASLQTTLDNILTSAITDLRGDAPTLDEAEFNVAFEDAYVMASESGSFDSTNTIPDNIPDITQGCELLLTPLASEIPALN